MPVFVDAKNQDAPGGESFPLGLGESIKTGFEEAAISGPFFGGLLANDIRIANKQGTLLTQAEAKSQAAAEGFPGLSIPSAGMTDQGLETMLALARDRAEGEERLSRASGVGAFVGSLAGSMDPVLGPLNFIPVVGASREAAILAKASIKAGAAGRILARGAIGAIEGAVGSVPSMALNAATRRAVGDDYTVDDAFAEFTSSVVLGGAMQAGIGQIGEGVGALADRSSHSWVREKFGTKSQEWRQLMEHDKRTADAIAADHARPEEVEPVAQVAPVEPSPPPGVAPAPVKGRRGWNESPFKRDRLEVSSGLRDALGDRVIVREARAKTDPLATEIFEAMRKNEGEITKTPEAIAPLANAADAVTDARRMGFTFDEALEYAPAYIGSDLDKMAARAQNLTFQEKEAARALIALEGQPERMARFVEEFQLEQQKQGATRAVEAAIALISTPKGPAEKGRLASPQTITNAEAIADFQARSGIVINPEKVIDADSRIDQAGPDAPAREIARADDPANRYDADELRQGRDKAKESEDLPDDEDYDALADEAEAELERLRKLTETEGARFAEGAALPESIDIGGVQRSTKDSTGRRLGRTEEEVRNFWAWFGDSKVVDEVGSPLVVYHGTNAGGEVFSVFKNPKAEDLGGDWNMFSESPQYSSQFAQAQGAHMLPVALSIQNPLDLSSLPPRRGDARNELISKLRSLDFDVDGLHRSIPYERDLYQIINRKGFREYLVSASKDKGYDGIKMPDSFDENGEDIISVTWIPFSPKQIKSATGNRGTFDPTNPDIRFAESVPQTETPEFKKWFAGSKVADEAGAPIPMYHGTSERGFSVFDTAASQGRGLMGAGAYFTDNADVAASYIKKGEGRNPGVYQVFLSIKNPIDMDLPAKAGEWESEFDGISVYLDEGKSNEDYLKAFQAWAADESIPAYEATEVLRGALERMGYDGATHIGGGRFGAKDGPKHRVFIAFEPEQIKSTTRNSGAFDPTNPDIRFAESDIPGAQSPAEAVRAEIADRFGEDLVKLGESNGLTIVNSWQDIPGAPRESVIGMTEGGKVWIAASGLSKGQAASVYLHEMGAHVGIRKMVGDQGFSDLQARAGAILDSSPELAAVVRGAIPRDTDPRFRAEEELAYLVQHFEEGLSARADWWPSGAQWARITDPDVRRAVVEFVRDLLAKAKAWLYENAPALRGLPLDERDLHAMAVRSLRSAGEVESGRRFAQKASEADSEIEAAKDLSKRVREVYKKAYDKVAAAPELADDALVLAARSAGLEKAEAVELVKRFRKMGNAEAALKEDMTTAALVRYRATLNAIKLHEGMAQIMRFKGNETEGALSLDAGSEWNVAGARARNVDSARNKWTNELAGGAEWELRQAKLFELAKDPAHGTHIVNALFDIQMDRKDGLGVKYNADHAKIAEIMNRFQMSSLKRLRRMGVDIGQIKGRMLHQMHDSWALRNFANGGRTGATRAGIRGLVSRVLPGKWAPIGSDAHMNAWVDFVAPLLDAETYDGRVVDRDYLEGSYKLLAGFKEPSKERELLSGRYSTGGVPGEAARLSSLGRNMKFKGPDEWAAYQKRCGNPDLLANFFGEQQATARSLAILEIYGPGGENTRAVLHQAVGQQLIDKAALKWQDGRKKREMQWAVVSDKINIPGNEILANVYDNAANLTRASILGGSVLSQAPDAVNIAKWRALRFNKGASGVYTESATHIQDFARAAAKSPKVQQVLESYRADMDATIGGLLREIENGDSKGLTANIVSKVYDYQGATWLNRNNKHASVLGLSNWLASEARHGFDAIEPTTRDMLLQQGIEAPEWELIRLAEQVADDGRSYLTPEGLASVPEAKISAHLESTGRKATPKTIEQWRDDTRIKLVGMMADEVSKSVIEPTARERLTATGGLSKGTWSGTMVRAMWMCKSFAISQFQRGWMSEVRGRSSDPRARVQAGSGSHYLAIANYIAALTGMGFVSYMLKGWATGVQRKGIIENEDEDDKVLFFDIPVIDDRVLFASMNQGGGLGIYGDFLFADADRYGGGFMQTLSGPLLGKVEDAYKLWSAAKGADEEDAGKLANQAVRMLKGATPFGNLWWSRHVMDRLLWWNIQESINPAGLQRLEDAAEKRGDTYIFTKPSAALN